MHILIFLILFPLVIACAILFAKHDSFRNTIITASVFIIICGTLFLLGTHYHKELLFYPAQYAFIQPLMIVIEIALAGYVLFTGIKHKRPLTYILISIQTSIMIIFELLSTKKIVTTNNLFVDRFSIIMALIVGIVGGLVALYSIGYMKELHNNHKELKDNRNFLFFVVFVFLSAMFGIVFSNNIKWLYFFWEITTLSSFFLIGYKQTDEARRNSFWALELNIIGGITFLLAIIYLSNTSGVIELDKMIAMGKVTMLIPVTLICVSGLIKAAQLPFSSWLLGAMAGPAPSSALLHSSTMVKAGVYIMLRFCPIFQNTYTGFIIALIGGISFLVCSLIAIAQKSSKSVLAYSTIANLGLIVLCAGIGTAEAMWAALLLIMFHAVSKCLLFLCVGTVENKIHSIQIEDMSGLILRLPKISIMMQIGMAGMFLAPFGMLISKWAALKALVDYNPLFCVFVVFGGAATIFFWIKWIGTLITVTETKTNIEHDTPKSEMYSLMTLSFLTVGLCLFFPLICNILIEPYLIEMYGSPVTLGYDNILIMITMLAMVLLFPLSFYYYGKKVRVTKPYLGGANTESDNQFYGAAGSIKNMSMENYYMQNYFGAQILSKPSVIITLILTLLMVGLSLL
ncbi:MAG: proton-conducting transporter membrane subunit [Candidatus Ancaeobacter aquaticus]|nr:proton-conducting transporter membrane subunit [Candidatus Ancaeobacter aquaticus]